MLSGLSPRPNGRLARRSRHPNQVPYMDKYSSLGKIFRVSWFKKTQFFNFNKNQYWYVTFLNFFCFKQRGLTSGPFNLKSQAYAQVKTMPFNIPVDHLNETYMVSRSEVRKILCIWQQPFNTTSSIFFIEFKMEGGTACFVAAVIYCSCTYLPS